MFTVGRSTAGVMEDEKLGGLSTARCGGLAVWEAGSRPERKNANMDVGVFSTSLPTATAVGSPSPFEPFMKGLRLEPDRKFFEKMLLKAVA